MKRHLLFILVLVGINYLQAQDGFVVKNTSGEIVEFLDEDQQENYFVDIDTVDLSNTKVVLKYIFNNQFSRLVTGNSLTGLGNYANISTANNTLSASINRVESYGVWDFTISGGSKDDITTFVNNSELNSGIGAGVSLHLLLNQQVNINDQDIGELQDAEIAIKEKYRVELAKLKNFDVGFEKQIASKAKEISNLQQLINNNSYDANKDKALNHQLKTAEATTNIFDSKLKYYRNPGNIANELLKLKTLYSDPNNTSPWKKESFEKDSIVLIGMTMALKDSLSQNIKKKKTIIAKIKANQKDPLKEESYKKQMEILEASQSSIVGKYNYHKENPNRLYNQKDNKKVKELKANRLKVKDIVAKDAIISWLTLGAETSFEEYSLFDETRDFDKQVYTENDVVTNFTVALSKYSNVARNTYASRNVKFYSFGVQFKTGNNINQLDLYEVRTTDSITGNRELLMKANAYKGDLETDQFSANIFGDYYKFFGNKNNIGLHLKGTLDIGDFNPITSFRAGAVFPFSKIGDLSSYLNIELFFGLNDIFKNAKSQSIFSRNVFGLQATVPFNFKIL